MRSKEQQGMCDECHWNKHARQGQQRASRVAETAVESRDDRDYISIVVTLYI